MTAVSTVHNGRGTLSRCDSAKAVRAAIVALRESPSCALCSRTCARSELNSVATPAHQDLRRPGLQGGPSLKVRAAEGQSNDRAVRRRPESNVVRACYLSLPASEAILARGERR